MTGSMKETEDKNERNLKKGVDKAKTSWYYNLAVAEIAAERPNLDNRTARQP